MKEPNILKRANANSRNILLRFLQESAENAQHALNQEHRYHVYVHAKQVRDRVQMLRGINAR